MVTTLVTCYYLLSFLKTDVNVPSIGHEQKKVEKTYRYFFCWFFESHLQKEQDPDPLSSDPRIRIRIKMSRIRNTVFMYLIVDHC